MLFGKIKWQEREREKMPWNVIWSNYSILKFEIQIQKIIIIIAFIDQLYPD